MVETVIVAAWVAASVFVIWVGLVRAFVARRVRPPADPYEEVLTEFYQPR